MLERVETDPAALAEDWVADFAEACASGRPEAIAALLREDAHWRHLASLRRRFATVSGRAGGGGRGPDAGAARGGPARSAH